MLDLFESYKNIVISVVIIVISTILYFYISSLKNDINNYKTQILKYQKEAAYSTLEIERYKTSLKNQNEKVKQLEINEELSLSKLKKWKKQKPEVRYKTITKIREVQSDECKDIKAQLDRIKHTDFSSLQQ